MKERRLSGKAICRPVSFRIVSDGGPSTIHSRYSVGKVEGDVLSLNPFEALYLYQKGKIKPENSGMDSFERICSVLVSDAEELNLFRVYLYFREKGFRISREGSILLLRKKNSSSPPTKVRVWREDDVSSFADISAASDGIIALLDGQGAVTIFRSTVIDPEGKAEFTWPGEIKASRLGESMYIVHDPLPAWFGEEFQGMTIIGRPEIEFLHSIGLINEDIAPTGNGRIFTDLVHRKFIVKTGFKYGSAFRTYEIDLEHHAECLVSDLTEPEEWYRISRAVRVSHAVRKKMVFSNLSEEKVRYVAVERLDEV